MNFSRPLLLWSGGIVLLLVSFGLDGPTRSFFLPREDFLLFMEGTSHYGRGWALALVCMLLAILGLILGRALWSNAAIMGLYALLSSGLLVQLIKYLTGRERPRLAESAYVFKAFSGGGFDSFPSGHAISAFALAVVMGYYFRKPKPLFFALASLVSFSRLYISAHFLSDVVAGALLGILTGRYLLSHASTLLAFTAREENKRILSGALVLGLAVILSFLALKATPLFDVDEAVFAESTREMTQSGQFIVPVYNDAPRYDKPILIYWLMASAFALFGVNEFGARFWSALAGCGVILATFVFVRSIIGSRCALLSALILATSLEFLVLTHLAITDLVLTLFVSGCLFCFFHALHTDRSPRRMALAGWALAAGAVLTKGPVGFFLPVAIIGLYACFSGGVREYTRRLHLGTGLVLFSALSLPWYIAASISTEGEFLKTFVWEHNVSRYLSVNSGHSGPWYYYLVVAVVGFAPWSAFLPAALRSAWAGLRDRTRERPETCLGLFVLVWISSIFLFFSLSQTKLPNYIAPSLPAFAVLTGYWWHHLLSGGKTKKWVALSACLGTFSSLLYLVVLLASPSLVAYARAYTSAARYLNEPLEFGLGLACLAAAAAASALGFFLILKRKAAGFTTLAASSVFFAVLLFEYLLPRIGNSLQVPLRDIALEAQKQLRPGEELIIFGLNKPSLLFYSKQSAVILRSNQFKRLEEHLRQPRRALIVTNTALLQQLQDRFTLYPITRRGFYLLVANHPRTPSPDSSPPAP